MVKYTPSPEGVPGLAAKRRSWQRKEERRMFLEREADWLIATSVQELVRRGRYWGR